MYVIKQKKFTDFLNVLNLVFMGKYSYTAKMFNIQVLIINVLIFNDSINWKEEINVMNTYNPYIKMKALINK